ncbi:MAG TPA: hypothetical protein ENG01_00270 [Candidatus Aenigmarchaeota archaeon]|nr:MAG: hypothetical protein DRN75_00470 [Nanoarchaeota archaeon]HDO79780.1 hypothetical protein [Candidatus Aenigmarchaeota archaeon]HEX32832.1 hypothetical protein [Candidatus Aenigmarchaeota archaeon]
MKIAVAAEKPDLDAHISSASGRSPYYLIFEDGKLVKQIKNPFMFGGGAGFAMAQLLADEGVELVIVGQVGPNFVNVLQSRGVKYKIMTGTVKQAVESVSNA